MENQSGPVSLGTTIVAMAFNGGVVLGADSRTSIGSYVSSRAQNKITELCENVYILRSGSASDTQVIAQYAQLILSQHVVEKGSQADVEEVASIIGQLSYNNKGLSAGMIVAGWDEGSGGSVWAIPLGGTLLQQDFASGGSGSTYIHGFLDKYWKAGMSREEALDLVNRAVAYAMVRDGSSGGCVRTVVIDKDGAQRGMVPGDKLPVLYGEMPYPLVAGVGSQQAGVPEVAMTPVQPA